MGNESKNSFAIIIIGSLPASDNLDIHFTLFEIIFFFCILIKYSLFSNNFKLYALLNFLKLQKVFIKPKESDPSPGPISRMVTFLGHPNFFQKEIHQIANISENKIEILGEVIKSPSIPIGFYGA